MAQRSPTSLRRKLLVQISLMIVGCVLVGAGALWGIGNLQENLGVALRGYRELEEVDHIGYDAADALAALSGAAPDRSHALAQIHGAADALAAYTAPPAAGTDGGWLEECAPQAGQLGDDLRDALERLAAPGPGDDAARAAQQTASVRRVLGQVHTLSDRISQTIAGRQAAAQRQRQMTLILIVGLGAAASLAVLWVGIRIYRSVVDPLEDLSRAVATIAQGQLSGRAAATGPREFAALAGDFNRMAQRLEDLYRDLEEKVQTRTRQLLRSERLAGVGFLAAGVAHEINNPLGIIAGYGERSLLELRQEPGAGLDAAAAGRIEKSVAVMCEEAFRCKQITDRLLSLARPGPERRVRLPLGQVAGQVVANLGGLGSYAEALHFQADAAADLSVMADEGQIRQVVLNLLINALEALPAAGGRVDVRVGRVEGEVELAVADNGRGMTAPTLERIFEPFFSDKKSDRHGTGLGLSITHSIVQEHGGRIRATSAGAGQGSLFVVSLPAAGAGGEHV